MPSSPCSSWDGTCLTLQVAVSQAEAVLKWGRKEGGALGTSSSVFRSSLALLSFPSSRWGRRLLVHPTSLLICFSIGKLGPACGGSLGLTSGPLLCGSMATACPASLGL